MTTSTDLTRLRLLNHRIVGRQCADPAEAVRRLGAAQAQDYQQSLWAIGLRTQQATAADVERAIAERAIIRTWPMRGTLHFVPAEDARWMLALSASRMLAKVRRRQEQLGLDAAILGRCRELFSDALRGGRRSTRSALMALLEEAGISTTGQRGYHILWHAAQTGLICLGPLDGKQQTFVLLDEWAPHARELPREEALAELARRYFTGHGPATAHDFAWWAGLPVGDARAGIEAAKSALTAVEVAGREHWMSADTAPQAAGDPSGVCLLPGFDEYLLGYRDRSAVLAPEHAPKIVPGSNGMFLPTIVVGGQVVGTWKRQIRKNAVETTLNPFARLDVPEERVTEAAERYGDFLGLPVSALAIDASH